MRTWSGRFGSREEHPTIAAFNASIDEDRFLLDAELRASAAWARALQRAGTLTGRECEAVVTGLKIVGDRVEGGVDLDRFEDVHSAVELLLVDEIGETGKKLHTGRSRNEQVVTDERLFLMDEVPRLVEKIRGIQAALVRMAEEHGGVVMPGYTHLQPAQCVLFAHYLLSFFWPLERGIARLEDALGRVDVMPLGSGALAGSTVPLDLESLRTDLGFGRAAENSMDAVADRSFILEVLFALALVLLDLSRLAEDVVIFTSAEFGFLELDDGLTTSSSLMPQKKNPDVFELIRAGPARLFGHLSRLFMVVKGLPMTYNKDLQEDKIPLRQGIAEAGEVLAATRLALGGLRPRPRRMREAIGSFLYATDLVDELVAVGMPFRQAHALVGGLVRRAIESGRELDGLEPQEYRELAPALEPEALQVFDPQRSIDRKRTSSSTHPEAVRRQIERARERNRGREMRLVE